MEPRQPNHNRIRLCIFIAVALHLLACNHASPAPAGGAATVAPGTSSATQAPPGESAEVPTSQDESALGRCARGLASLLDTPLRIDVYSYQGKPPIENVSASILASLRRLARASEGKIVVHEFNTATDGRAKDAAKAAGIRSAAEGPPWAEVPGEELQDVFVGIVLAYKSAKRVKQIDPPLAADASHILSNEIRATHAEANASGVRVGVVSGKGHIKLSEPLVLSQTTKDETTFRGTFRGPLPFYRFEDIDASAAIPNTIDVLLVPQPDADYTDDELGHIDRFVMRGGGLVVIASAASTKPGDPTMTATLDDHRLGVLLAEYGMELRSAVLADDRVGYVAVHAPDGNLEYLVFPGILTVSPKQLDKSFEGFSGVQNNLIFPFTSPLILHADKQPGARLRVVARAGGKANANGPIKLEPQARPRDQLLRDSKEPTSSEHVVAVAIDGSLTSAFSPGVAQKSARVLVLSSAQFLSNPFVYTVMGQPTSRPAQDAANSYARSTLHGVFLPMKNIFDWASHNDALIACTER